MDWLNTMNRHAEHPPVSDTGYSETPRKIRKLLDVLRYCLHMQMQYRLIYRLLNTVSRLLLVV